MRFFEVRQGNDLFHVPVRSDFQLFETFPVRRECADVQFVPVGIDPEGGSLQQTSLIWAGGGENRENIIATVCNRGVLRLFLSGDLIGARNAPHIAVDMPRQPEIDFIQRIFAGKPGIGHLLQIGGDGLSFVRV